MKVLLIDNNRDREWFGSPELTECLSAVGNVEIHVRRGPDLDLPVSLRPFDAIVISGSKTSCMATESWMDPFDRFLGNAMENKIPMLGVCFGHQSIARVLGGRSILAESKTPEIGWTEIEVLRDEPLFDGLSKKFHTFSLHYEEVVTLPPQMKNFARSAHCAHQATSIPELGVYTIQFHPERSQEKGDRTISQRWKDGERAGILGLGQGAELFDPKVGEKIFSNFIRYSKDFRK